MNTHVFLSSTDQKNSKSFVFHLKQNFCKHLPQQFFFFFKYFFLILPPNKCMSSYTIALIVYLGFAADHKNQVLVDKLSKNVHFQIKAHIFCTALVDDSVSLKNKK